MIRYFGIRHLSAAGGYHVKKFLEEFNPSIVLVEGPCDLTPLMKDICSNKTKPPIAMLAYTKEAPIKTILYPLAEYSPEYVAIKWANENNKKCEFIDLPSGVFLNINENKTQEKNHINVYDKLENIIGEDIESYLERIFEHNIEENSYEKNVNEYGKKLREISLELNDDDAENVLREAYMKYKINSYDNTTNIAVITGAFHVEGLKNGISITSEEIKSLESIDTCYTLMPYSYYRLSSLSGYGAGNYAPAYYEILYRNLVKGTPCNTAYEYLSRIAKHQRNNGFMTSSAEVIEAVRLSNALAAFRDSKYPSLLDLKDAVKTCIAHGDSGEVAEAFAEVEIGTKIGKLEGGVSNTSIQKDFYHHLKELKLEKYKKVVIETIDLDLRENRRVKSQKSAFLDLERSFFLHRLILLNISFAKENNIVQDNATYKEQFNLHWTPETEIEIIEAAIKGDTIEHACNYTFMEMLNEANSIKDTSKIISLANLCNMPKIILNATNVLKDFAISNVSITEIGTTSYDLCAALRYGNIRQLDNSSLIPVLKQLIYRASLIAVDSAKCDNNAIGDVIKSLGYINEVILDNDFFDDFMWLNTLKEMADRDDINTKASGFACAILLERGKLSSDDFTIMMERRLNRGIPADLGAGWFEGLAMKNKYTLISRLSVWQKLESYIDSLDEEEFKRSLVFLRRAFSEFSSKDKYDIGENLGEIWGLNKDAVSEAINTELTEAESQSINDLEDFNFDDF